PCPRRTARGSSTPRSRRECRSSAGCRSSCGSPRGRRRSRSACRGPRWCTDAGERDGRSTWGHHSMPGCRAAGSETFYNAPAHAVLFAEAALNVAIVMPALGMPPRKMLRNASDLLLIDLLCYAAIVAIEHGRRYYLRSLRLESDLRQARLHALEAQLRPHFLFNALNTISSLIRAREDQAAIRSVAALGDVLRGALRQTEPEVALRDELGLAERYLD